jgi:hypothetical protein
MQQITTPEPKEGEIYAGTIINPDGTGNHIMLLDDDKEDINWKDALEWAQSLGGDLPTRVEQALLFDQHKDKFDERAYWSNTQHASHSGYAWCQRFNNGYQSHWGKVNELRARAVRRISFSVI